MHITLNEEEESSLVCLEGAIDISCAAELKTALLTAMERGLEVRVDMAGVADLDVTAVQLLWAAERETKKSSLAFTLIGQPPQPALDALKDAGFEDFLVSN